MREPQEFERGAAYVPSWPEGPGSARGRRTGAVRSHNRRRRGQGRRRGAGLLEHGERTRRQRKLVCLALLHAARGDCPLHSADIDLRPHGTSRFVAAHGRQYQELEQEARANPGVTSTHSRHGAGDLRMRESTVMSGFRGRTEHAREQVACRRIINAKAVGDGNYVAKSAGRLTPAAPAGSAGAVNRAESTEGISGRCADPPCQERQRPQ